MLACEDGKGLLFVGFLRLVFVCLAPLLLLGCLMLARLVFIPLLLLGCIRFLVLGLLVRLVRAGLLHRVQFLLRALAAVQALLGAFLGTLWPGFLIR